MRRVTTGSYTVVLSPTDRVNDLDQNEQLALVTTLASLNTPVIATKIFMRGYNAGSSSEKANVAQSMLDDYFRKTQKGELWLMVESPSFNTPNVPLSPSPRTYKVTARSDSGHDRYTVDVDKITRRSVSCTCPSFVNRGGPCKHMDRVDMAHGQSV